MKVPQPPLFFSTFPYAACKVVGAPGWPKALEHELAHLDESPWAGFRTLGQARRVAECRVHVDASTYITRARCVAAGRFLHEHSDLDVWLTCDDDVFATEDVIAQVTAACRATRGLVALPYLNRDGRSMTFRRVTGPTEYAAQVPLRRVDRIGMGLAAMHRDFVSALAANAVSFENQCPAIFLEGVTDVDPGVWTGEDFWLCGLAERAKLPMHAILNAPGEHEGLGAMLDLDGQIVVCGDDVRDALEQGIADKNAEHEARTAKHRRPPAVETTRAPVTLMQCSVCKSIYASPPETCCPGGRFVARGASQTA